MEPFIRAAVTEDFNHFFKRPAPMSPDPPVRIGSIERNDIGFSDLFPRDLNDFSGKIFRAAAFTFPPYSIMDFEGTVDAA